MDQGGDTVIAVNAALSKVAQRFTTGPEAVGFTLGSVGFFSTVLEEDHDTAGDYLSVTLNAVGSGNNPGDALCTLSDPLSFSANAVNTFTAPASCPALAANTDYFVVIDRVVLEQRDIITLSETSSSSQDDGGAAGWSINDNIHFFKNSWATPSKARVLQVEIKGVVTTRPSAPGHLSARVASSTQIDLAWDAPTNQGASDITGYKVEASTDSGSTWSDLAADTGDTDTDFEHTGLSSGNTRHYRVSAINTQGRGLLSDVASTTIAVPTAPRSVKATAGNRQVTLVWDTPSDNRVNSISKYQTRHKKGAGSYNNWSDVTGGPTARTRTISSLDNNAEYTFQVRAINPAGNGAESSGVKATPFAPTKAITYRYYGTNHSITRGSTTKGDRIAPFYLGASSAVETDTTFILTWNGRPTNELHPGNPTTVTIKKGTASVRFSLRAARDDDDPRVYNQPVKADVVATLGALELSDQLIVFDDEPLPRVTLSLASSTIEEGHSFKLTATLSHRLDTNTSIPIVMHNPSNMTISGSTARTPRLPFRPGSSRARPAICASRTTTRRTAGAL